MKSHRVFVTQTIHVVVSIWAMWLVRRQGDILSARPRCWFADRHVFELNKKREIIKMKKITWKTRHVRVTHCSTCHCSATVFVRVSLSELSMNRYDFVHVVYRSTNPPKINDITMNHCDASNYTLATSVMSRMLERFFFSSDIDWDDLARESSGKKRRCKVSCDRMKLTGRESKY